MALVEKSDKSQDELTESSTILKNMITQHQMIQSKLVKLRKECSATNEVSRKSSELDKVDKNIKTPFKLNTEITPKDHETIDEFVQQKIEDRKN